LPNVILSALNLLAASETLRVSQERWNAIAPSIAFMVVEILRLEVVLMMNCWGVHGAGKPSTVLETKVTLSIVKAVLCGQITKKVCKWPYSAGVKESSSKELEK
jgi:hypothetical protein